jgi:hypothetical protein
MIRYWALPALFMAWALLLFLPHSALYGRARGLVLGGGAGAALRLQPPGYVWRAAASLIAVAVAAWSLSTYVNNYEHGSAVCDYDSDFVLLPALFSISLIWLFSEAILVTSAGVLERPVGRLQALLLGFLIHFSIGTIGWLTYPNVGYNAAGAWRGAGEWIPMWIVGLLFKVGLFITCE